MNYPYAVILDKEEDIPVISKEQIEQFKKEMSVYHDSDWVNCKDCLFRELENCHPEDENATGCYRGEKMEDE
jgi:hypothetical protein